MNVAVPVYVRTLVQPNFGSAKVALFASPVQIGHINDSALLKKRTMSTSNFAHQR